MTVLMLTLCNTYRQDRAEGESLLKKADRPFRFGSSYVPTSFSLSTIETTWESDGSFLVITSYHDISSNRRELSVAKPIERLQGMVLRRNLGRLGYFGHASGGD